MLFSVSQQYSDFNLIASYEFVYFFTQSGFSLSTFLFLSLSLFFFSPVLFVCLDHLSTDLSVAQHFVAMRELSWKTEPSDKL